MTNPLVAGPIDTTTPFSGLGLLDDGFQLSSAICDKSWVSGGLAVVSGVADTAMLLEDPIGTLLAWGIAWIIDHLEPIKGWFYKLTGNPGAVMGGAQTWANIEGQLVGTADYLLQALDARFAGMQAATVSAYKALMGDVSRHIGMVGELAKGISMGLTVASIIVQVVHDIVRDILSQLVGTIISAVLEAIFTVGLAIPAIIAQVSAKVATFAAKLSKDIDDLITSFKKLGELFTKAKTLLSKLKSIFDEIIHGAAGAGKADHAIASAADAEASAAKAADNAADAISDAAGDASAASRTATECPGGGDPVDMATGRVFMERTDVALNGVLPLVLRRRYLSDYRQGRSFGTRWASTLDERVVESGDTLGVLRWDASTLLYPAVAVGGTSLPRVGASRWPLTKVDEGTYRVVDPVEGLTRTYTRLYGDEFWLSEITDRAGRWIRFERLGNGVATRIIHHGGYDLAVGAEGTRVTAIELVSADSARLASFGFDDAGELISEIDGSGDELRYEVDEIGRMVAWVDGIGVRYVYNYDDEHRCVSQGTDGGVMEFHYRFEPDAAGGHTTVMTDPQGFEHRFVVDSRSMVLAEIDPLGNRTEHSYDAYNRRVETVDPLGGVSRFGYDEASRLTSVVDPTGATSRIEYDEAGFPVRTFDASGAVTVRTFDDTGALLSETAPTGAITTWERSEDRLTIDVTDPTGRVTTIECDAAGLPIVVTDSRDNRIAATRDAFGRVIERVSATGDVTRTEWTPSGRPLARVLPDGNRESWAYDGDGNLVEAMDASGRVTRHTYGPFDVRTSTTTPDGATLTFDYDGERRLVSVTNQTGRTWRYERDGAGRIVREIDYDGRETHLVYDPAGNVVERVNAAGQRVAWTHDAAGRVLTQDAAGSVTSYAYDAAGRLLDAVGPDVSLRRTLDAFGRVIEESVNGADVAWAYDAAGRLTSRTMPSGTVSEWSYDEAGDRVFLTLGDDWVDLTLDAAGRTTRMQFAGGTVHSSFDAMGRLTGRSLADPSDPKSWGVDYTYAPTGELLASHDTQAGWRRYELDGIGRITRVGGDAEESYSYDAAGNITNAAWLGGERGAETQGQRTFAGTLVATAGRDSYAYDKAGRLVRRTRALLSGGRKEWTYTWDALDRLTDVTVPDGSRWSYTYDPFGRRVCKQHHALDGGVSERVDFAWDGVRLAEQTVHGPTGPITTTWEYQGFAPVAQTTRHERHDPGSGAAGWSQERVDAEFAAIITDLVGTPVRLVDGEGRTTWVNRQTTWGATDAPTAMPLRFPGQYADPETGLYYNLNRYYNPDTGAYVTTDPMGLAPAPNATTYPTNPTTQIDPLGLSPYPPISMDEAIERGVAHVGGSGEVIQSGSGGFQFISHSTDQAGTVTTKIARFDVNPASPHVQKLGPHLNLETHVNGRPVGVDPHTPIDPATVRPGDIP